MQWLEDILVVALLISTMFAMGLTVKPGAIAAALARRWAVGWALAINLLMLPILAATVGWALGLEGPLMLGLLLAASVPGGGTGTLLTFHARGDVAFSVLLLGVLTLVSAVVSPLMVVWLSGSSLPGAPMTFAITMIGTLLVFQLLPLMSGILLRRHRPQRAEQLASPMATLSTALLVVLVLLLIVLEGHRLSIVDARLALALVTIVGASLVAMAWWPRSSPDVRAALALTTGTRNLSAALLLAAFFGGDPLVELAVLVYGVVMYLLAIPMILAFRNKSPST